MLNSMKPRRVPAIATALLAAATLSGCVGEPPTSGPSGVDGLEIPTPSPDPADFAGKVDNPWFPLVPGTVWTYRATGDEGTQTDVVTVTDDTRVVQGVTTVVVHDVATNGSGKVIEDTYDWYAQDDEGNVWYFGEDTTAYDKGRPDTEGSWEAGVDGAEAGLLMPAQPRVGDGYQQEYRKGVAEDRARILSITEQREVAAGTFEDLVQTEDTTPLEPELVERKYYAEGVGVIYEETIAGGDEQVELIDLTQP